MRQDALPPRAMAAAAELIAYGVTTDELDASLTNISSTTAVSSTLVTAGLKSICTSVNDVVCHGIPDARPLPMATSSTSTSRTSMGCTATPMPRTWSETSTRSRVCLSNALARRCSEDQRGRPYEIIDLPGVCDFGLRQAIWLRRRSGLHWARHRRGLP